MEFSISIHCVDSKCPDQVVAEGFTSDDSGLYVKQNKTGKFEDSSKGSNLERPVYRHESLTHRCIWWHKPYRHWWLGNCISLGENHGHAWLAPDSLCPHQGQKLFKNFGKNWPLNHIQGHRTYFETFQTIFSS